ncbi:hypothetical protein [Paraglaciecola psychrophila]|jgi:hypothetical protein|uniref:DinB family protein n=1 Tax=Paraglaciecola psychrophila 170 TaxID=1129794 RepID=K6Z590_9ALTE|nr:hypothetical protein [Paraglaciecola psychrophila]AGH47002.1 hypothetical protein C427_4903 [Paraglaciecola psychrophila 170]GAC40244.1 hypothetical protein GPSY_4641 [Paraglaciecola psychrophila 170]
MFNNVIALEGQLETVQQAKDFLLGLSAENYQVVIKPHFASSAGAHMRHILDHYLALKDGLTPGFINYNKRNRYSNVESCPQTALLQWQEVEKWLIEVSLLDADTPLIVVCEASVNKTQNTQTKSTLARELVFVSSHAVHHFSLLAVINSLLGNKDEINFGIAPSTATYVRQQA